MTAGALLLAGTVPLHASAMQSEGAQAQAEAAWDAGDYSGAVAIWRTGAQAGEAEAQFRLAEAYRLGQGVPRDMRTAEALYSQAAAQGHLRARDNYGLLLYESGQRAAAIPYLDSAAKRGDPRAQYVLGVSYYNGDGVARDWPLAYALVSLADTVGLAQAGRALAQMDQYLPDEDRAAGLQMASEIAALNARENPVVAPSPTRVATAAPARSGDCARKSGD